MRLRSKKQPPGQRPVQPLAPLVARSGAATPTAEGGNGLVEFFRFRFAAQPGDETAPRVFTLPLEPVAAELAEEIWFTAPPVETVTTAGVRFARNADYLVTHWSEPVDVQTDIAAQTRTAYATLLRLARGQNFPGILRTWNYLPEILRGRGDSERYRQFSLGRAAAFDDLGYTQHQSPAATAIGTRPGAPLNITLLACRERGQMVENPRQLSAYAYPRQYGPRSPSFSRAALVTGHDRARLMISGTASIVGHESRHAHDFARQFDEILDNLDALIDAGRASGARTPPHPVNDGSFRIYLRDAADRETATRRMAERLPTANPPLFLRGEFCRPELVAEIEGLYCY